MLWVVINFLFNGFILSWAFCLGFVLFHFADKPGTISHFPEWTCFAGGYSIILFFMLIGYTKIGQWLVRLLLNIRPPLQRERQQIDPLLPRGSKTSK